MKLKDTISLEHITILKSTSKEAALLELIALIEKSGKVQDISALKESIFYREKLMSTGIGCGIAVPHVRLQGVAEPFILIGVCYKGIDDYESLDNQPVRIGVMIIAGKEQHRGYIQLLSEIISHLKNKEFTESLIQCDTVGTIHSLIMEKCDD